ncbi:tyrosine-type recombinase/integrase [Mycobacterium antarcticum]|uniref:tyrosine-type recombinase/integrase n=1 Tax=Mycolicibacterium sp. TUM20985 TaxID=3023370 RepID=UPI0033655642
MMAERWLATKATRAPKTVAGYRSLLEVVVLPRWRDVPLREVTFDGLQEWVTGLSVNGSTRFEGKGLSASRVIQAHQVVAQALRYAVRAKHLPASPADGLELPRKSDVEQRYLSHEQLHRLAVAAGRFRTFVLVLGYCGLRFGEATALRIGDVNLETRRIRVSRSVTYVTGTGLVEGGTKNHTSRSVPIPKFLIPLLKTEIGERDCSERLFPSGNDGDYLTIGEVRWVFDPAATAIDEAGLTPHELRHTCASLAIAAGANVKVLQTLLGHKTATLTLDRYGHLFPDDLGKIADAFDAAAVATADGYPVEKGCHRPEPRLTCNLLVPSVRLELTLHGF